ncbi:MAG: hypothetical protein GY821_12560 [Gammaproteobacteria bacterium]|nr:hypothetical protein [Gammaproteobacteria bacterium]
MKKDKTFFEKTNTLCSNTQWTLLVEINLDPTTTKYYCNHKEIVTFEEQIYRYVPMLIVPAKIFEEHSTNTGEVIISDMEKEVLAMLKNCSGNYSTCNILKKTIVFRIVNLKVFDDFTAQDTTELMVLSIDTSDNGLASFILELPNTL